MYNSKNIYFKKLKGTMQFKYNNRTLIYTQQKNKLYIIKSINKYLLETTFHALLISLARLKKNIKTHTSKNKLINNSHNNLNKSKSNTISKVQKRKYKLMHKKFSYYKIKTLQHLYKVISKIKKIIILLKKKKIYKIYKIEKIKRKKSKKFATYKDITLKLISLNITSFFIKLICKFKYFL